MHVIRILFFIFLANVGLSAQQTVPPHIEGIPHPLFWENQPEAFSYRNGVLTLVAGAKTDMFRDPNVTYNTDNAPKLLFHPDGDFILSARIEHTFDSKWDGGAIVLKNDSLSWIKFCFEKDYTGARRVVSVVTKNISDDCNSIEIRKDWVYFKIAKAGNVITLYCSENGRQWLLVRHFQFDAAPNVSVGFLAQSPTGKRCTVRFSAIKYEARAIRDPYLGD
ncbi:MAG TPA: DUF1349 domain-containing protein [Saprospiraceae bacterium]|nr:DUF1349 domain-containing protein [Saprospiraceae bacterium]HNL38851.1 DUF1349 domain-containing protein [Saprospiraceae bacterium]HNM25855.1 DUF1349 domain-containing protein [Saprospiraceae bacterium]